MDHNSGVPSETLIVEQGASCMLLKRARKATVSSAPACGDPAGAVACHWCRLSRLRSGGFRGRNFIFGRSSQAEQSLDSPGGTHDLIDVKILSGCLFINVV